MTIVAVLIGGVLGTALRLGLDAVLPHSDDAVPVSTLIINTAGSFALALLVARLWPVAPHWLRFGLGTGLLGSFTTFSAVAVSLLTLTRAGMPGIAALYLVATLAAGLAAALLGLRVGHRPGAAAAPQIAPDE
ncbi:MAG TPA: CrcB family protein [Pseudolysinimonas sp.]|nr:CrcB family protein [Pseudolysinimonas sp.]